MNRILLVITIFCFSLKVYSQEMDLKAIDILNTSIKEINESKLSVTEKENANKELFKKAISSVENAKSNYVQTYQFDKVKRAKEILVQLKSGNIPITSVDDLLNKMQEAINGDTLKDVKSFSVKMSTNGKTIGTSEILSINNKIIQIDKGPDWEATSGYDGKDAWVKWNNVNFLTKLNESEKDDIAQTSLDAWKDPKSYYAKIEFASEKFEGKECYVLICKNKKSGVSDRKFYVDKSTFLISGYIFSLDVWAEHRIMSMNSKIGDKRIIKMINNSYKKCENGVLYADSQTQWEGKTKMELKLIDIKFNPIIDEKLFQKPNLKEF